MNIGIRLCAFEPHCLSHSNSFINIALNPSDDELEAFAYYQRIKQLSF